MYMYIPKELRGYQRGSGCLLHVVASMADITGRAVQGECNYMYMYSVYTKC